MHCSILVSVIARLEKINTRLAACYNYQCAMESQGREKSFFIFLFINPARVITEKDEEETIMIVIIRPTAAAAASAAVEFE
jgi:hypothetical protein